MGEDVNPKEAATHIEMGEAASAAAARDGLRDQLERVPLRDRWKVGNDDQC